ncbi:MAG: hypothetical protein F4Z58_12235 [Acidimicrobiaceae bacterium]|nr:hypothetical protein [Acidimicrobiaceae bacterium]
MTPAYPRQALGDLLDAAADPVEVDAAAQYRIAGVLGFGRGVFERGQITGADTKYARLFRLHQGTLVYSKLKAFEGAIAVVGKAGAGAFVSQEFPTFRTTPDLDSGYLAHVCRWPLFWETLAEHSRGVGARRERLHPDDLLATEIPLPNIGDQRRIAAHLDGVSSTLQRIERLRSVARTKSEALPSALSTKPQLSERARLESGWLRLSLGEVMEESTESVEVALEGRYPNLGIYSFGRGVFEKPPIDGMATSAKKLNRVRSAQFIFSRLFAFEGAYTVVPDEFDGYFVSKQFPCFDVDPSRATAAFIAAALRNPQQWRELARSSKGLGLRRQTIQVEALLAHELWFPPISEQHRIVEALQGLDRVRGLLEDSDSIAASVFPAALNRAFAGMA